MEKLINSLPKEVGASHRNEDGSLANTGICLRWSVLRQKWICGYGVRFRGEKTKYPWVEADDPVEALAFFIELRNQNGENKEMKDTPPKKNVS